MKIVSQIEQVAILISNENENSIVLCCIYYPLKNSPFNHNINLSRDLLFQLVSAYETSNSSSLIITGDIDFADSDWNTISSKEPDEEFLLDILANNGFEQMIPTPNSNSLEVVLTNNPQNYFIKKAVDFSSIYSINKKQLSDHDALSTEIRFNARSQIY